MTSLPLALVLLAADPAMPDQESVIGDVWVAPAPTFGELADSAIRRVSPGLMLSIGADVELLHLEWGLAIGLWYCNLSRRTGEDVVTFDLGA